MDMSKIKKFISIGIATIGFYVSVLTLYDEKFKEEKSFELEKQRTILVSLNREEQDKCYVELESFKRKIYIEASKIFVQKQISEHSTSNSNISKAEFRKHLAEMVGSNEFGTEGKPKVIAIFDGNVIKNYHYYMLREEFDKVYNKVLKMKENEYGWHKKIKECKIIQIKKDEVLSSIKRLENWSENGLNIFKWL